MAPIVSAGEGMQQRERPVRRDPEIVPYVLLPPNCVMP
jgi:hypothetical protein